jgi:peroxiredoxin
MQTETPRPAVSRRLPATLAVPVIALATIAVVVLATRPLGGGEPAASFFVIGSAGPGLQIGQIAPGTAESGTAPLPLADADGIPVQLATFDGHPLWLIFWKTACEPCEAEAPAVEAAYAAHRGEGLSVLGIDVWDSAAVVGDYARDHRLAYPIAIDASSSALAAYGVWGAPTHYFIGADGIIRDRYFGPMSADLIDASLRTILPAASP